MTGSRNGESNRRRLPTSLTPHRMATAAHDVTIGLLALKIQSVCQPLSFTHSLAQSFTDLLANYTFSLPLAISLSLTLSVSFSICLSLFPVYAPPLSSPPPTNPLISLHPSSLGRPPPPRLALAPCRADGERGCCSVCVETYGAVMDSVRERVRAVLDVTVREALGVKRGPARHAPRPESPGQREKERLVQSILAV